MVAVAIAAVVFSEPFLVSVTVVVSTLWGPVIIVVSVNVVVIVTTV